MQRSHKIRLDPTVKQEVAMRQAAGTARFTWNYALAMWKKQYDDFKLGLATKPDVYSISRRWTQEKPDWAREVACGLQNRAIMTLGKAMISFWNGKTNFPKFHKKSDKSSFYVANSHGYIKDGRIHITNVGKVKLAEAPRFEGRTLCYTVSHSAGKWFVSVQVELTEPIVPNPSLSVVGVDVGIKNIAVASDGTSLPNPHFLIKQQRQLKYYQRQLARQVKGSNRRNATKTRIAKIHQKIVNQRQDCVHKFTTALAKNHGTAVIETLDIESMKSSDKVWMNRALQDTCMREVHRQLEYKMRELVKAPKFFPSSKTCSSCGDVKESLPPSIRVYRCQCGLEIDRDLNAALNLRNRSWVTTSTCVETSKGSTKRKTKLVAAR